jgi:hypothetical protein
VGIWTDLFEFQTCVVDTHHFHAAPTAVPALGTNKYGAPAPILYKLLKVTISKMFYI